MIIFGSGLAGCLAGFLNQSAKIYEPKNESIAHKAILRFRSPNIGEAVGIPFKKVKIYKGIWHNDKPVDLSPRYISLYSRKVSDTINYRSICNLNSEYRWIAPDNFHEMLKKQCEDRITYNANLEDFIGTDKILSTVPIYILAKILKQKINIKDNIKKIYVSRYKIPKCNVWMTYYYTDPTIAPYRASISGDILIIESIWPIDDSDVKKIMRSFGLTGLQLNNILDNYVQPNGKISGISEDQRRKFILETTLNYGIYSLGRFATWRNLVLDDVYHDILKIKEWMNKDLYSQYKEFK